MQDNTNTSLTAAERIRDLIAERIKCAETDTLPAGDYNADRKLVDDGKIEENALLAIYSSVTGIPLLDEQENKDITFYPDVTYDFLNANLCLPVTWNAEQTTIAVAAPYDLARLTQLWQNIYDTNVQFLLARRAFIERCISAAYDRPEMNDSTFDGDSEQALRDLAKEAPIVRLVNDIFTRAQETGTSDIHVEPVVVEEEPEISEMAQRIINGEEPLPVRNERTKRSNLTAKLPFGRNKDTRSLFSDRQK